MGKKGGKRFSQKNQSKSGHHTSKNANEQIATTYLKVDDCNTVEITSEENVSSHDVSSPYLKWWDESPSCGLRNMGNTCFFNSCLQCLYKTPLLHSKDIFHSSCIENDDGDLKAPMSLALIKLFSVMRKEVHADLNTTTISERKYKGNRQKKNMDIGSNRTVKPSNLFRLIQDSWPLLDGNDQQDAHELFCCLTSSIESEEVAIIKESSTIKPSDTLKESYTIPYIQSVFGLTLCSRITCGHCESLSHTCDPCVAISLELPGFSPNDTDKLLEYTKKGKSAQRNRKNTDEIDDIRCTFSPSELSENMSNSKPLNKKELRKLKKAEKNSDARKSQNNKLTYTVEEQKNKITIHGDMKDKNEEFNNDIGPCGQEACATVICKIRHPDERDNDKKSKMTQNESITKFGDNRDSPEIKSVHTELNIEERIENCQNIIETEICSLEECKHPDKTGGIQVPNDQNDLIKDLAIKKETIQEFEIEGDVLFSNEHEQHIILNYQNLLEKKFEHVHVTSDKSSPDIAQVIEICKDILDKVLLQFLESSDEREKCRVETLERMVDSLSFSSTQKKEICDGYNICPTEKEGCFTDRNIRDNIFHAEMYSDPMEMLTIHRNINSKNIHQEKKNNIMQEDEVILFEKSGSQLGQYEILLNSTRNIAWKEVYEGPSGKKVEKKHKRSCSEEKLANLYKCKLEKQVTNDVLCEDKIESTQLKLDSQSISSIVSDFNQGKKNICKNGILAKSIHVKSDIKTFNDTIQCEFNRLNSEYQYINGDPQSPSIQVNSISRHNSCHKISLDDNIYRKCDDSDAEKRHDLLKNEYKLRLLETPSLPKGFDCAYISETDCLDLDTCFASFTKTERLSVSSGNGYECSKCCKKRKGQSSTGVDAEKQMLILDPPLTLVCHFKRLRPHRKSTVHVAFPEIFDLTPFCWVNPNSHVATNFKYLLYGVVVHQGGSQGGHYIAYTRGKDGWVLISDEHVQNVSLEQVLKSQAYMLFYESFENIHERSHACNA